LKVNFSEIQNCRSPSAFSKLASPTNFGGVMSDQLFSDTHQAAAVRCYGSQIGASYTGLFI
jgi:hypothetical protein